MTTFRPPGPGSWILDRSHYDSGMTRLSTELMGEAVADAYEDVFEKLGIPLRTVEFKAVHGFPYGRRVPLVEPRNPEAAPPPSWLLRALVRIVPAFRRRNRAAAAYLAAPTSAAEVAEWETNIKPSLHRRNTELQSVELSDLDDRQLTEHLATVVSYVADTFREHHRLHGYDLVPIGMLLVTCRDWGIDANRVLPLLTGASPATIEPVSERVRIRELIGGAPVASLDEARQVSPDVATAIDAYLTRHGAVLFGSYDIDAPTLGERSEVVLSSILSARPIEDRAEAAANQLAEIRAEVPDVDVFDDLVREARAAMNMRDDNGPLTVEWPAGLLRLALVETGRRCGQRGLLEAPEHVFELARDELDILVDSSSGPDATELATRAARRFENTKLNPPATLGPDEPEPDLSIFPEPTARMLDLVTLIGEHLLTPNQDDATGATMNGIGVGSDPFDGVARVASSASEAMEALQDGEVLVTRVTSPAFNLVLSIAGALVTAEGGAMSHAAVLSRELNLPAVIGVAGCLDQIANGDTIRVNPKDGTVELLETA